jgi:hypothetical protein
MRVATGDLAPLGPQEDWEEPPGRSGGPFMHWVRHHDKYGESEGAAGVAQHATPQGSDACCKSHVTALAQSSKG